MKQDLWMWIFKHECTVHESSLCESEKLSMNALFMKQVLWIWLVPRGVMLLIFWCIPTTISCTEWSERKLLYLLLYPWQWRYVYIPTLYCYVEYVYTPTLCHYVEHVYKPILYCYVFRFGLVFLLLRYVTCHCWTPVDFLRRIHHIEGSQQE